MSISHAVQQALDYFSNSPEWFAKVNQTKKVAGFRLKGIHPLALILENQGITIFVQQGSWLSNPTLRILQGGSILCWLFNQRIVVPDNCHPNLLFLACFSGSARRSHSVLLCSEQTV